MDDPAFSKPIPKPQAKDPKSDQKDAERVLNRSGDMQERGRAGLANVLMVLGAAILAGCVQLKAQATVDDPAPPGLRAIVCWAGLSLGAGLLVSILRFLDAEGYRRVAVNHNAWVRGRPRVFNEQIWSPALRFASDGMLLALAVQTVFAAVAAWKYVQALMTFVS